MPYFIYPHPSSNAILTPAEKVRSSSFRRIEYRERLVPYLPTPLPGPDDSPFINQNAFVFRKTHGTGFLLSFFYILNFVLLWEMICSSFVHRILIKKSVCPVKPVFKIFPRKPGRENNFCAIMERGSNRPVRWRKNTSTCRRRKPCHFHWLN